MRYLRLFFVFAPAVILLFTPLAGISQQNPTGDAATDGVPSTYKLTTPISRNVVRSSRYLTMRDGVKIAIDLYLPEDMKDGDKLPTIILQTRYWRSANYKASSNPSENGLREKGLAGAIIGAFVTRGYAWVEVDTRGSGASFGNRIWDCSPQEVADGAEVADWIIAQSWSSGKIGVAGTSYSGNTAYRALVNKHPAIKAAMLILAEFDTYGELILPGGIPNNWWHEDWGKHTSGLDRNIPANPSALGVRPVDEDKDGSMLKAALLEHTDNYSYTKTVGRLIYRDDFPVSRSDLDTPGKKKAYDEAMAYLRRRFGPNYVKMGMSLASPNGYIDDVNASGAAVFSYEGWFDGSYQLGAIRRHKNLANPDNRLVIGPWDHTLTNISPFSKGVNRFNHLSELFKFFDYKLKGIDTGYASEKRVHYFTMGEERWKSADTFPVPATATKMYFGPGNSLTPNKPTARSDFDKYVVDQNAGTGNQTRWNTMDGSTLTNPYPDRAEQDKKLLVYDSAPLSEDTEVTGHPVIQLFVNSTATDGAFFVYLEDIDENGKVIYVTEGLLRSMHRKLYESNPIYKDVVPARSFLRADAAPLVPGKVTELKFDLLPTSYQFKKHHKIRIAIAGADKDHFAMIPEAAPAIGVFRNQRYASSIVLPVVKGK